MRRDRPSFRTAPALVLALCFGLACGSDAPEAPEAAPQAGAGSERIEIPEAEEMPGAPAELRGMGEMPDGYPADLPVFPGAEPTNSMMVPGSLGLVVLSSKEPAEDVFAFYEKELPAQGWEMREVARDKMRIQAAKGTRAATLTIGSLADRTEISIVLAGS